MLGLFVIYFIGQRFYRLAGEYGRNSWMFALLGVATYYGAAFLAALLLGITIELFSPGTVEGMNETVLGLMALPFGILGTMGLFYLLRHIWSGNRQDAMDQMDPKQP